MKRAAFEPEAETYSRGTSWRKAGLLEKDDLTGPLRAVKEGKEIEVLRKSCRIAVKAPAVPMVKVDSCNVLKSKVRVANSEINLDGDLLMIEGVMTSKKEEGALWVAFPLALIFPDGAFKSAVESAAIAVWARKEKI